MEESSGGYGKESEDGEVAEEENVNSGVRDISKFPACMNDNDCELLKEADYKCFQYMCYPWNTTAIVRPFRSCRRRSDCLNLREEEGGDGEDGDCFRKIRQILQNQTIDKTKTRSFKVQQFYSWNVKTRQKMFWKMRLNLNNTERF